mmetsp:Transcript_11341/g.31623  ORF Transcript_11341/g.31623 Transcript_11341/m.31623 type:complete len:277 (-) Transcript_11341:61-891(-)
MGLFKQCFGLTLVPLSAVVVLFAALAYDFDLVFEHFPGPLFMFIRYFEASDPTKPAPRNVMTSPGYQNCSEMMVHRAAANCGVRCKLVLVGDSITEAVSGEWCGLPGMVFPDRRDAALESFPEAAHALVLATAGDQTQHTLFMLDRTLHLLRDPGTFFVMIGTNNVAPTGGFSPAETVAGIRTVVQRIRSAHPGSEIVLHGLLPRFFFQDEVDAVNTLLESWAGGEGSGLRLANCSSVFPSGRGPEARELMKDLLHPTAQGYRRWYGCLRPLLQVS